jgi:S-adenosylmethionine decarboxylase
MLGKHVILDVSNMGPIDMDSMCKILSDAATEVGCTILFVQKHLFPSTNGYTAVIGLAESHISIHTWPEHDCCAIDIFMCGECNAEKAAALILTKMNNHTFYCKTIERL